MPKVQVVSEINLEVDQILNGVAQLDTLTLEKFLEQVSWMLARRKASSLPQAEADLLQQISQSLPVATRERYQELNEKLHEETITQAEHQEFLALVNEIELADAQRLQHLIALAQLRGVSLNALMEQLGLRVPVYA